MNKNTIRLINAAITFSIFIISTTIVISKILDGEELFFRHYLLGYLGSFCLFLSILSLVNLRNRR